MRKSVIILGSGSRFRAEQLKLLGLEFKQIAPVVDEDEYKQKIDDPVVLAITLSDVKAEAVKETVLKNLTEEEKEDSEYIIIGSDQLVEFEGEILGKPGSPGKAVEQLLKLSGKVHSLITAITVIKVSSEGQEKKQDAVIQTMKMYPLTEVQSWNYVNANKTWDCAGSYQIEGEGVALFESISGEDFTSIVGLPLLKLIKILKGFCVEFFSK